MMPTRLNLGPEALELAGKLIPLPPPDPANTVANEQKSKHTGRLESPENVRLVALWRLAIAGESDAADELLAALIPKLRVLANAFTHGLTIPVEDLIQEALLGVWRNLDAFEPERGSFVLWARYKAKEAMLRCPELRTRISRHHYDNWRKVQNATDALMVELGRKPTTAEIAERAGLSEASVEAALARMAAAWPVSLDELLSDRTGRDGTLEPAPVSDAQIVEPAEPFPQDRFCSLDKALQELTERERFVVISFHYDQQCHRYIAATIKITEANSKQSLKRALTKLRRMLEDKL